MSDLLPFFVMTDLQAARFRDETANQDSRVEPIKIRGGPQQGKWGIREAVIDDPDHADLRLALRMLTVMSLDRETAFPPLPEE